MANNSGVQQEVFNTLERVLSDDVNRLQAFQSALTISTLRNLFGVERGAEIGAAPSGITGSALRIEATPASGGTPARGIVLGGLDLTIAAPTIAVNPGITVLSNSTSQGADDDAYMCGALDVASTLAFTSNAASIRWDVIEVSITPNTILETATRDIFNPSTQTFTSTPSVTKVRAGAVSVRIRTGTAGLDPTFAAGWLPVAMVHHPGATASFNDCNIFDVRPLVADMVSSLPSDAVGDFGSIVSSNFERLNGMRCDVFYQSATDNNMTASVDTSFGPYYGKTFHYSQTYRIRGRVIAVDNTGADAGQPNIFLGTPAVGAAGHYYCAGSVRPAANDWMYACLIFPWGLPRWQRYSKAAINGLRRPIGCGGIFGICGPAGTLRLPVYWSTVATNHAGMIFSPMVSYGVLDGFVPQVSDFDGWVRMATSSTPVDNIPLRLVTGGTSFTLALGTQIPNHVQLSHIELGFESAAAGPTRFSHVQGTPPVNWTLEYADVYSASAAWLRERCVLHTNNWVSSPSYTTNVNTTSVVVMGYKILFARKL